MSTMDFSIKKQCQTLTWESSQIWKFYVFTTTENKKQMFNIPLIYRSFSSILIVFLVIIMRMYGKIIKNNFLFFILLNYTGSRKQIILNLTKSN